MGVKNIILAMLTTGPATGYKLRKRLADSPAYSWIVGSQVYRILDAFVKDKCLDVVLDTSNDLGKKTYSLTAKGHREVNRWFKEEPKLPEIKNELLQRLAAAAEQDDEPLVVQLLEGYAEYLSSEIKSRSKNKNTAEGIANGTEEDEADNEAMKSFEDAGLRGKVSSAIQEYYTKIQNSDLEWVNHLLEDITK
jgi:DNA-binding PadR family transcriptional regulator